MGNSVVGLLPPKPESADLGLREVIDRALAEASREPPWIAVEDVAGEWLPLVAERPAAERARGVAAVVSDSALVSAHRLGVGGAATLPLSSTGFREALSSASSAPLPPPAGDPGLLAVLLDASVVRVAAISNAPLWRAQLGDRVLSRLLAELAQAVDAPPAVVPWPALVTVGQDGDRLVNAWKSLASGPGRPTDDLVVLEVVPGAQGILPAVYSALVNRKEEAPIKGVWEPVHELPSGHLIGWWASGSGPRTSGEWVATPAEIVGSKCRWQLHGEATTTTVEDVFEVADIERLQRDAAVRVPGSLTDNLRPGTPSGILVHRLADAAARRGVPLWVPNVDTVALKFLLRLPGTLWVDGPAVPR